MQRVAANDLSLMVVLCHGQARVRRFSGLHMPAPLSEGRDRISISLPLPQPAVIVTEMSKGFINRVT